MTGISRMAKTLPMVIGIGLLLSACDFHRELNRPGDTAVTWQGVSVGTSTSGWHSGATSTPVYPGP